MSPKLAALALRLRFLVLVVVALLSFSSLLCSSTRDGDTLSISPRRSRITAGTSQQFTAWMGSTQDDGVSWSASQGTISSSGLFTAPNVNVDTAIVVTAVTTNRTHAKASATVHVQPSNTTTLTISPTQATLTSGGSQQFTSNLAVSWSATQGTISSSGLFKAPAVSANTTATVTATSTANPSDRVSATVTIQVQQAPLVVSTNSLSNPTSAQPYSATLLASGGKAPYNWSIQSGSLPAGLSLNSGSGVISGTTNALGVFSFSVQVGDSSSPPQSAGQALALDVVSGGGSSTAVQPTFFGIHVNKQSSAWPNSMNVQFGAYRSLSGQIDWSDINTAAGVYDWSSFDQWLGKAQSGGQDILYTLYRTPNWAASKSFGGSCSVPGSNGCFPPNDLNSDGSGTNQHFKDFVTTLMTHVAPGAITYLEVWNEPNITTEWAGSRSQLIRMAQDARTIAKGIDPNIQIVSPAETGDGDPASSQMKWLDGFLGAGGGAYVDVIGFHGYIYPSSGLSPEVITTRIDNLRSVAAKYGQQNKPIFDTEGSWGVPAKLTDPDLQRSFTARQYLIQIGKGVNRFYWFGWDMPNTGFYYTPGAHSLIDAGTAYQQIYAWTVGATPGGACSSQGTVWTCSYTRPGGYQALAVWDTSQSCAKGTCTTSTYSVGAPYVQYRELDGVVSPINGASVPIGLLPIWLESGTPH